MLYSEVSVGFVRLRSGGIGLKYNMGLFHEIFLKVRVISEIDSNFKSEEKGLVAQGTYFLSVLFFFPLNTRELPSAEVDVKFMEAITLISTCGIVLLPFLNSSSLSRVNK